MASPWPDVEVLLVQAPQLFVLLALLPVVLAAVVRQRLTPGKGDTCEDPCLPIKPRGLPGGREADGASTDTGSAAACWARGDGRLKYRILRPDPGVPEYPPRFSLANLELTLPSLAEGEAAALKVLAASLADLRGGGRRTDDATLLRFLRARKGNVQAAGRYFREAELYRDELDLQRMDTHWNLEAYERCFAPWWARGGIMGLGLKGQVVGLERLGRSCFPQLLEALPWKVLQRLDALHTVRVLAAFEEDALRRSHPIENNILILDLDGLGKNFCTLKVLRAYARLVAYRDMLLPCTLGHVLVIRAPKVFSALWVVLGPLIDPGIREKVQIASGDEQSLAMLRKYIGDETIPAYLGGALKVDGDPECRAILGSSSRGPVPAEALARLEAAVAGKGADAAQPSPGGGAAAGGPGYVQDDDPGSTCCCRCMGRVG
mmetsp:Transcript_355/g.1126  ORF Transcript_355/g.1126 Transcript_355/m.1126 type:complete len:433 (-) Transcript_355:113-1411(-)